MKKLTLEIKGSSIADFQSSLKAVSEMIQTNTSNDDIEYEDGTSYWFEVRNKDGIITDPGE